MLRSCSVCGRVHDSRRMCRSKPAPRDSRASRFRSTYEWQAVRERVRGLDLNVCVLCRSRGRVETGRLGVHHIVPLEEGYDLRNEPENLVTLCPSCHEEAERGGVSRERLRELIGAYREQSPPG